MKVSLFEISYKKKMTFSRYSIFFDVPVQDNMSHYSAIIYNSHSFVCLLWKVFKETYKCCKHM